MSIDQFEEHVAALHADSDYLLSQEYEVQRLSPVLMNVVLAFSRQRDCTRLLAGTLMQASNAT